MRSIAFSFCLFTTCICRAMEPTALTNAVTDVMEHVLAAAHGCDSFMKGAAEYKGWTSRDCTDILTAVERSLRGDTEPFNVYRRQNAISLLGEFGGTNAVPELVSLMQEESGVFKQFAGWGYLRIAMANPFPGWEMPLQAEIARSPVREGSFAWQIYNLCSQDLEYAGLSSAIQRNYVRFLLDQTAVEQGERAMLDEILCREVPKWRASPQRLANAERMIREHSNDAGAVSFFEGVRADALSAGALAREQNPDGRSSGTPADSPNQGGNTKDAADPWADLLDDLPEKQPWTPPDGMVPAS